MPDRPVARSLLRWTGALTLAACASQSPEAVQDLPRLTPGIFLEENRAVPPEGTTLRPVIDRGIALTKRSEGFVGHLYNDAAGYCTVAYGHLLHLSRCDGQAEEVPFKPSVPEPRGAQLLITDLGSAQYAVMQYAVAELTDTQYAALVDFAYNVGGRNLSQSRLLKLVNRRQFDDVPTEWRKWVQANGKTFPGLVERRERELQLFFDGNLPESREVPAEGFAPQLIDIRVGG